MHDFSSCKNQSIFSFPPQNLLDPLEVDMSNEDIRINCDSKTNKPSFLMAFLAPRAGLEPATY